MNKRFHIVAKRPDGEEPPTPQPTQKTSKPFDPKNPPKGICEICLDPKYKTAYTKAHGHIHYVHKKCYAKAHAKLLRFLEVFYIGDFKDVPKEQRAIWLWLHEKW